MAEINKRSVTEQYILKYLKKMLPNGENAALYKEMFEAMSDKQFSDFMKALDDGTSTLAIIVPNLSKERMTIENNLNIGEEIGHKFFERIWMIDDQGSPPYLSTVPYLIVDLPLRRQAQLLVKKIRIPEDNKAIDDFSGQPSGKSKGSKISYPEIQILAAMDVQSSLTELLKVRGGDLKAFNASNKQISDTGGFSIKAVENTGGEVTSKVVMKSLLTSMHITSTGL